MRDVLPAFWYGNYLGRLFKHLLAGVLGELLESRVLEELFHQLINCFIVNPLKDIILKRVSGKVSDCSRPGRRKVVVQHILVASDEASLVDGETWTNSSLSKAV